MVNASSTTNNNGVTEDLRNRKGIKSYSSNWSKDSSKENEESTQVRLDKYAEVVNGYYDGATGLYEWGWGTSFHFCRYYRGEPFYQAISRHEHYLSAQMGIKPGMRVLDIGCGVGGPAREIARFADCNIVGLNNNAYQVSKARKYTKQAGLEGQVEFVVGDFMKLVEQFGENSFDAVYAIEATCHAPSFEGVYGEVMKVLKPGGIFGCYEWCMTDKWDPSNPHHKEVAHGIEVGDGIAEMRPIAAARSAFRSVGFEILNEEDLADRPDTVRWYYPLEGQLKNCQTFWDLVLCWRMTSWGKVIAHNGLWMLEKFRIVPEGTHDVGETLRLAAVALVAGGREKLFTPMMLFVGRKPTA